MNMIKLNGTDGTETWVHLGHIATICGAEPIDGRPVARVCFVDGTHADAFGEAGAIVDSLFADGGMRIDNANLVIRKLRDEIDRLQESIDNRELFICWILKRYAMEGRMAIPDSEVEDLLACRIQTYRNNERRTTVYKLKAQ